MFHDVGKLSDISGPSMIAKGVQRLFGEDGLTLRGWAAKTLEQMVGQIRYVVDAFSQRRKIDFKSIDAIHQVFTEVTFINHLRQVSMGRADNANIDLERFIVTDTAYFAALQHAEQFGLHGFGEFADFIKK